MKRAYDLTRLETRYPQKRAAITGAADGVGAALAHALAARGWRLWLNDIDGDRLSAVAVDCSGLGADVERAVCDVADATALSSLAETWLTDVGGVDLVFTCAGIGVGGSFLETPLEHFREVLDVNVMGTVHAGKAFLPAMKQAGKGHFVTIASAAAFHGLPRLSAYAASKAAVVQLTETLRSELAPHGVDVSVKMTTFYRSSIADHTRGTAADRDRARSLIAMAKWSSAEVAQELLLAVQKGQFYVVGPRQGRIIWRAKRLFPERYLRIMPKLFERLEARMMKDQSAH